MQEINQYLVSEERLDTPEDNAAELNLEDSLNNCVKHHEMILEFIGDLEDYFRWFQISKFGFSSKFHRCFGGCNY